jgi:hypothetical protein
MNETFEELLQRVCNREFGSDLGQGTDLPHSEPHSSLLSLFLSCTHEAEWTPFQTNYFSENLVVPGIEPEPLDL